MILSPEGIYFNGSVSGLIELLVPSVVSGVITLPGITSTLATLSAQTFAGVQTFSDTTNSTSTATGAIVTAGGLGVAKDVWVGGLVSIVGPFSQIKAQNAQTLNLVQNTDTGVSAQSTYTAASDTATADLRAHGSGRTATRYGVTLGGFGELSSGAGNGLLIGTITLNKPIIFGTNSLERLRIGGDGSVTMANGNFGRTIVTETAATRTVALTDNHIICNRAGTITLTLPAAASFVGRELTIRTITANTVVSAASDVVPLIGGAAGTAILAATAGKWAYLISDGANWQIQMAGG